MTVREQVLWDKWRELRAKECISMDQLDDLMYAVEKLLMNYKEVVESRDNWRKKYKELKK